MKLMIIWGSSRQGRQGGKVAEWVKKQAETDSRLEIDFVDPRDIDLPFYDEPGESGPYSFARNGQDYTHPEVKAWAQRVDKNDGFIFITPEYNHGYPAVLKNLIDWVGPQWKDKPAAIIGYGGIVGGARALEQLRLVTIEAGLVAVANPLHFPYFEEAFDENGQPKRFDYYEANLKKMFDELIRLHRIFSRPLADSAPAS